MALKTIEFSVATDGSVSPATEQKAGVQGCHNVTKVQFEANLGTTYSGADYKKRLQFIDGAGGFHSTGFLDVVANSSTGVFRVSSPLPDDVTNAGGLAHVYLVVTKITYVDGKATENQVFVSNAGKLRFAHSGVGSPSEYAYKSGVSSALVNAETFAGQAEDARDKAEELQDLVNRAVGSANLAKNMAEEARDAAASAALNAENRSNSASVSATEASKAANEAKKYYNEQKKLPYEVKNIANEALNIANTAKETVEAWETATEELEGVKKIIDDSEFFYSIKEKNKGAILSFWVGSTAEYEALEEKPNNCYVIITDDTTLDLLKTDYIVEQGITDGWTYRKWASGIAECWGEQTREVEKNWGSSTMFSNGGIYTATDKNIKFPFDFTQIDSIVANCEIGKKPAVAFPSKSESLASQAAVVNAETTFTGQQTCITQIVVKGRCAKEV